jgi:hypothetical protein
MRIVTVFLVFISLILFAQPSEKCLVTQNDAFALQLNCLEDFNALAGKPNTSKYSHVSSLKLVYVLSEKKNYFTNSDRFHFHYDFCREILGDSVDLELFNQRNYHVHSKRKYLLVNLNYYQDQKRFLVELFPGEECKREWMQEFLKVLRNCVPAAWNLSVLNNNTVCSNVELPATISLVSPDQVYLNQRYQCLKEGIAYGYLKKVSASKIALEKVGEHDIVILDNLPLHLPWVQAVVTQVFQTPLSHINVLCSNRGIPNCAWKDIGQNKEIERHLNKLVRIQVKEDKVVIVPASLEVAQKFWKQNQNNAQFRFKVDLSVTSVVKIDKVRKLSVASVGAKAFNFAQLAGIKTHTGKHVQVPENAFVIPFYFYVEHLQKSCIPEFDSITILPRIVDPLKLKAQLKKIRKSIETTPVDTMLLKQVQELMQKDNRFAYYRFRSSTNAEDIEGFNGAGLYESHSGSWSDSTKKVEDAIRKVWASLWNYTAYMEREYFRIDHFYMAMGILVHRAFGDDEANGVAITRHLYRKGYPAYTVNVQAGETSVVSSVDTVVAEQFVIVFKGYENETEYSLDFITHSSLSKNETVLTSSQVKQLVEYLRAIKKYYFNKEKPEEYFYDYALDVEFKVDSLHHKVYIKQVRPFK